MTGDRVPVRATVIVPTTGDRGSLLPLSVGSIQRQTVEDIEVFIVGDGVDDPTRDTIGQLCDADDRLTFVDHPKDARRGERHRHEVLTERARGRIVAYLCDRDLWFSDHLAVLDEMLDDRVLDDHDGRDIASTLRFEAHDDGTFSILPWLGLDAFASLPSGRRPEHPSPLSGVGHTLAAYRALPHGWRTTPAGVATDSYMWHQFLDQPGIRAITTPIPTVIWLRRGDHPGLPTAQRRELLERWNDRLTAPGGEARVRREILTALWSDWMRLDSRTARRRWQRHVRTPLGRELRRRGLR